MGKKSKVKEVNYLAIIFAIIIAIIFGTLTLKSTNIVENVIYSYDIKSNLDYKVFIFDNSYVQTEYMNKGKTYISDLVDRITLDYNYEMKSSKKLDSSYDYTVTAKTTVKYSSTGEELWNDEVILVDNQDINLENNKEMKIITKAEMPFKTINDKVKNFKNQFNIPLIAYADVDLYIKDKATGEVLDTIGITLDLNEEIFKINETGVGKLVKNVTQESKANSTITYVEATVTILAICYVIISIYKGLDSSLVRKSYYSKAIYKILKNYGDIVAELVKPVDLTGLKVIDVKNFDQMLDVEEELRIPIMFYETIKNEEGHFLLVHQDMAYRYILRDKLRNK